MLVRTMFSEKLPRNNTNCWSLNKWLLSSYRREDVSLTGCQNLDHPVKYGFQACSLVQSKIMGPHTKVTPWVPERDSPHGGVER